MERLMAIVALASLCACGLAVAQEEQENLDRMAAEQQINETVQEFIDLGMEPEAATFLAILSETGMSPAEIVMFMMMADKGGDDAGGFMLLMNAMKSASGGQPVVVDRGDQLLVLEGGVLFVIDMTTMEVTQTLDYARAAQPDPDAIWRLLIPIMGGGHAQPGGDQAAVCRQRLRALHGAFAAYVDAHDGVLPGEDWVEEITPYLPEAELLRCPSRPEVAVAYAMNERLVGAAAAAVVEPGERVLLFDTVLDDPSPVGGPEAVPLDGAHDGGVNVLFVSGEVEWLPVAEARELLGLPVGG